MTTMIPAWVNGTLRPAGKLEVHREGWKHPAVSVFVNHGGETLLQRRAAGKYHTPGLWSNACCTHPGWGEAPEHCAARRLGEELGIDGAGLRRRGQASYRAEVGNGLIEDEVVEIFTLDLAERARPRPDPAEVAETRWIGFRELRDEVGRSPEAFTPWLAIYLDEYAALLGTR